jgi:hypothetical protein
VLGEVDISQKPEFLERCRNDIPIVLLDGQEVSRHVVREHKLLELLRQNKTESEDVLTMKAKLFVTVAVAALLVAGAFAIAQAPAQPKPAPPDPRIDRLLEQNDQILKNQQDILKQLGDLKESILILKRRSS